MTINPISVISAIGSLFGGGKKSKDQPRVDPRLAPFEDAVLQGFLEVYLPMLRDLAVESRIDPLQTRSFRAQDSYLTNAAEAQQQRGLERIARDLQARGISSAGTLAGAGAALSEGSGRILAGLRQQLLRDAYNRQDELSRTATGLAGGLGSTFLSASQLGSTQGQAAYDASRQRDQDFIAGLVPLFADLYQRRIPAPAQAPALPPYSSPPLVPRSTSPYQLQVPEARWLPR